MPFKLKPKARARSSDGSAASGHAVDEHGRPYIVVTGGLPQKCVGAGSALTDEELYAALKSVNVPRRVYLPK